MKTLSILALMMLFATIIGCGGGSSAEPITEEQAIKQMAKDQQEAAKIQAMPYAPGN